MADYPTTLPQPSTTAGVVDPGLLRSDGGGPQLEQRTSFNSVRTDFSMSFEMDNSTYRNEWLPWVEANAFDWFNMDVITNRLAFFIYSNQLVRFTGPVTYQKRGDNWLSVSVTAELIPNESV